MMPEKRHAATDTETALHSAAAEAEMFLRLSIGAK